MKICWDNLEKLRLNNRGNFIIKGSVYIEKENCKQCREPYLAVKDGRTSYCCIACSKIGKSIPKEVRMKISEAQKGRKHSEKTKQRISESHKGKQLSKETKKKISENNARCWAGKEFSEEHKRKIGLKSKGRKLTEKTKEKISNSHKGKKLSATHRKKISQGCKGINTGLKNGMYGMCGPLNPNWKGGIACEPYCDVWIDKEYKESIKERDNYVCQNPYCWHNSKRLCIHHIDYNKKNCKPGNLITVCTSCNARANFDRDWHQSWYQSIINKRYGGK